MRGATVFHVSSNGGVSELWTTTSILGVPLASPDGKNLAFNVSTFNSNALGGRELLTRCNEHHITKSFTFPDFKAALAFVNKVGEVAESQGHHPDILLGWGKAEITTWTHKINGLTESDFILAAKIDQL